MMIVAPMSARFVERIGTKLVVGGGLLLVVAGLVSWASLDRRVRTGPTSCGA